MEIRYEMMVQAYGIYLQNAVDSVSSFSTRNSYTDQAADYYENPEEVEKPPHLDEAEDVIGFDE